MFLRSADAPLLKVTSLLVERDAGPDEPVSVAQSPYQLPALEQGANLLLFTIENVKPKDTVQLFESCEGGQERVLGSKRVGKVAGGGPDPEMRFTIDGQ